MGESIHSKKSVNELTEELNKMGYNMDPSGTYFPVKLSRAQQNFIDPIVIDEKPILNSPLGSRFFSCPKIKS